MKKDVSKRMPVTKRTLKRMNELKQATGERYMDDLLERMLDLYETSLKKEAERKRGV